MRKYILSAFADEAGSTLDQQIRALKRNGFTHLEIRGVDSMSIGDVTGKKASEIKARLSDEGISVLSIGSPFGKQQILDDFGPHFDKFKHCLETAVILGAKYMRIFSFFMPHIPEEDAKNADETHKYGMYFDEVINRLSGFIEEADKAGIILCHENEKGIYGDVAERCLQIHKALPELRAVFDPANFVQCGVETYSAWTMLKPFVEYMHIKDAMPNGTVVAAGRGVGNVKRILSEYTGEMLTLEPHLAVFEGLAKLEQDRGAATVDGTVFGSKDEAFDFAAKTLKQILAEL
jgi:sugar phosphate isomerase/epimerase